MIDSAGKYGAGLALEFIGWGLKELNIKTEDIIISNNLGWYRVPLESKEPTFESGIWVNLKNDAVQKISYNGILKCWKQGCDLLGSLNGAVHLSNDNAGVLRPAQRGQKPRVEQKAGGKRRKIKGYETVVWIVGRWL